MFRPQTWLLAGILALAPLAVRPAAAAPEGSGSSLPRFTETREAAALFFIKKHVPEVLPLLEQLKKSNPTQYQQEIREVFQVTEMLADLQEDPPRQELELKVWKTETRAHALVARLSTPKEEDRKKVEAALMALARELVDLDIQILKLKADQLDKELGEVNDELARAREQADRKARERYERLVNGAKPRKK